MGKTSWTYSNNGYLVVGSWAGVGYRSHRVGRELEHLTSVHSPLRLSAFKWRVYQKNLKFISEVIFLSGTQRPEFYFCLSGCIQQKNVEIDTLCAHKSCHDYWLD